jgi:hypothetical protein
MAWEKKKVRTILSTYCCKVRTFELLLLQKRETHRALGAGASPLISTPLQQFFLRKISSRKWTSPQDCFPVLLSLSDLFLARPLCRTLLPRRSTEPSADMLVPCTPPQARYVKQSWYSLFDFVFILVYLGWIV